MPGQGNTRAGRIFSRLNDLPSQPRVVEKLLCLPEARPSREFADLIALDQGLTAKVLRLVNSAFYSRRAPLASVRMASSLLGVRTLKSIALSASVIRDRPGPDQGWDPVRFWRHSLAAALAARRIAEEREIACLDEVYAAGLLHDIGIGLLAHHYPAEYGRLAAPGSEGTSEALAHEVEEFGESHADLGYHLLTQWRLPALIALGVRHHHTPLPALPPDLDPDARRLIEAVEAGDWLARRSGHAFGEADRIDPHIPPPGVPLDEALIAAITEQWEQVPEAAVAAP